MMTEKAYVISVCQNEASDGAALTVDGRAFQIRAADTGNARLLSVEQRVNNQRRHKAALIGGLGLSP